MTPPSASASASDEPTEATESTGPATPADQRAGPGAHRTPSGCRALREVPGFWRIAATGMLSKLPTSMTSLGLLLLISRHHSYGIAGLAMSCAAIGQGLTAPVRGRLVDRRSHRPVLLCCLAGQLGVGTVLVVVVRERGSPLGLLALAALLGACTPPVAVMMRAVGQGAAGHVVGTAMALDSAMTGAALIVGPALAGWLSVSVSPDAPLITVAVLSAAAVWSLTGLPAAPRPVARRGQGVGALGPPGLWGPLRSAPLRRLLAVDGLFVCAVTGMDVVLPSYAREHGTAAYAGWCLAALSVGSVVGGLVLGAVPALWGGPGRRLGVLLCVFAAGAGALACAARVSPPVVLLVCPVAGLAIGSVFAALRTTGGDLAPEGRITETMSWLSTLDLAGGAVGAAVFAQVAAEAGSGPALIAVAGAAVLATAVGRLPVRAPQASHASGSRCRPSPTAANSSSAAPATTPSRRSAWEIGLPAAGRACPSPSRRGPRASPPSSHTAACCSPTPPKYSASTYATGPAADQFARRTPEPPGSRRNPGRRTGPPSVTASKSASVIGMSDRPWPSGARRAAATSRAAPRSNSLSAITACSS
ncbi:MFS transporter [Streptomyces flavofungini]|uniref:MFS transporter n=1 Tax=Streptomyces flavofungini TaxID=68200 RepID=UPI0025B12B7D|nr:MFS transporter [Streptomyces flavofungini]WJV50783.1 MFS transporter [Streptomyces flavofungini]